MNVLVAIQHAGFGGVHALVETQYPLLRDRGITLEVVMGNDDTTGAERLRDAGIHVEQISYPRIRKVYNPLTHLSYLVSFRSVVKKISTIAQARDIDIVHVTGLMNLQAAFAAKRINKPLVWQINGTFAPEPLRTMLSRIVRRKADKIFVEGKAVLDAHKPLADFPENRIFFFYPGINLDKFKPDAERRNAARLELGFDKCDIVIGTVGNRCWVKGHDLLIKAALMLKETHNFRWLILGAYQNSNATYYRRQVEEPASEGGLFVGNVLQIIDPGKGVAKLLPAIDLFVLCSRAEGAATAALEAQSCGIPLIVTDVGALRESVVENASGIVIPPNDVNALIEAILQLSDNEGRRKDMGRLGRDHTIKHFDEKTTTDAYIDVYASVYTPARFTVSDNT